MTTPRPIRLSAVEHAMLIEISKRLRLTPDQVLKKLIQETYDKLK